MMKFQISNLKFQIVCLVLAFSLQPSAFAQTPVLFPVNTLFGGAAYNKPLTLTAANTLLTDGQNLWAGTYTIVPASITNPVVYLYPNTYLLTVPGVVKPARFTVPAGTNVVNVATLLTSGALFYFGTNGFASLVAGTNVTLVTNRDGSITVSASGDPAGAATNAAALASAQITNQAVAFGGGIYFNPATGTATFGSNNLVFSASNAQINEPLFAANGNFSIDGNGSVTTTGTNTAAKFVGNGSGLTNLNALALTGGAVPTAVLPSAITNGSLSFPYSIPGIYAFLTGLQFTGLTNGATISSWIDLTGNGHNITCTGVTLGSEAIGGQPALCFNINGQTSIASNATAGGFFAPYCNSNLCMCIVIRNLSGPGIQLPAASGINGSDNFQLLPSYDTSDKGWAQRFGANAYQPQWAGVPVGSVAIYTFVYNCTNGFVDVWVNGTPAAMQSSSTDGWGTTLGGFGVNSGNLYLGRDSDASSFPFYGYIGCVLIYSNAPTVPQVKSLNNWLASIYNSRPKIYVLGDSQGFGFGTTSTTNSMLGLLQAAFPQYEIVSTAHGAWASGQILSNAQFFLNSPAVPGSGIYLHENGDNDNARYGSYTGGTNYLMALAAQAHSNGYWIVASTSISITNETATKTNFWNWQTSVGPAVFDAIANGMGSTNYGFYQAFTNGVPNGMYSGDNVHLSNKGEADWVLTNCVVSAIKAAIYKLPQYLRWTPLFGPKNAEIKLGFQALHD